MRQSSDPPLIRAPRVLAFAGVATLLVWAAFSSPVALEVPSDLRDSPKDFADLAGLHEGVAGGGNRCAWCHAEWRPGGGSLALQDSARWIASAAPATSSPAPVTSHVCLSCHDNSLAVDREDPASQALKLLGSDPAGNHPIDVSYREASQRRPGEYHDASSPDVRLEGGKVGCISCHVGHSRNGRIAGPSSTTHRICQNCHNL